MIQKPSTDPSENLNARSFLEQRLIRTRRHGTILLAVMIPLLVFLYILLVAGGKWISTRVDNPGILVNDVDRNLRKQLPVLSDSVEKQITTAISGEIVRIRRNTFRTLPRIRSKMESEVDSVVNNVVSEVKSDLSDTVSKICLNEHKALIPLTKSSKSELQEAHVAFWKKQLQPLVHSAFIEHSLGHLDMLIALHRKVLTLKSKDGVSPEELVELRLLTVAADTLSDAVGK